MNGPAREPISIVIVDDHAVVRQGLRSVLAMSRDVEVVGEASNVEEAMTLLHAVRCDVALLDLRLGNESGVDIIRALRAETRACRTIIFTSYGTEQYVHDAVSAGANGFLLKHAGPPEILTAIRTVHSGHRYLSPEAAQCLRDYVHYSHLTPRELEILELLIPGTRNRTIADTLGITEETVKAHIKKIFLKLGVRGRTEAVTHAVQRGLVRID